MQELGHRPQVQQWIVLVQWMMEEQRVLEGGLVVPLLQLPQQQEQQQQTATARSGMLAQMEVQEQEQQVRQQVVLVLALAQEEEEEELQQGEVDVATSLPHLGTAMPTCQGQKLLGILPCVETLSMSMTMMQNWLLQIWISWR